MGGRDVAIGVEVEVAVAVGDGVSVIIAKAAVGSGWLSNDVIPDPVNHKTRIANITRGKISFLIIIGHIDYLLM